MAARLATAADFGLFVVALAVTQVLAIICTLGTAPAAQLVINEAIARNRPWRIRAYVRFSVGITILTSLAATLLILGIGAVADRYGASGLQQICIAIALLTPVMAMSILREFIARAFEGAVLAFVPRDIGWTLCFGATILLVPESRTQLIMTGAAVLLATELLAWLLVWMRYLRIHRTARRIPARPYRRWMERSLAMMSNFVGSLGFERVDVLAVGLLASFESAGIYGAATRTASFVSVSQRFVVPLITPRVARALASRDRKSALKEVWSGFQMASLLALPTSVAVFVLAPDLLSLFGEHFESGAPVLRILVLAYLATVLGANFGVMVTMGARPWLFTRTVWAALIPTVLILPFTTAAFGMVGAACTVAVGIAAYNLRLFRLSRASASPAS